MYATIIKLNTLHNESDGSTVINRRSWRKTRLKVSDVHSSLLNSTKEATGQKVGDEVKTNMIMKDEGWEGHEHKVGEMRIMKRHENAQKPDGDESGHHTIKGNPEAGEDKISTSTATTITPSPTPSTLSEFLKGGSNHSSVDPTLYSDKSSADTPLYSEFRDNAGSSPAKANLIVTVCAAVVGVVVIFAVIFFALRYWKQSQEQGTEEEEAKKRHMSSTPVLANRTSRFPRSNSSDTESGIRQCVWQETRENEQTGGSFADRMSVRISKRFNSRISIFSTSGDIESQSQTLPVPQPQAPQPYDWSQLVTLNISHMGVHPGTLVSVPITSPPLDNSFDSNFGYEETTRSTPELNDKHTTWPERRRGDGPDGITIPPPGSSSPYSSTYSSPYSSPYSSRPGTLTSKPSASRPLTPIQKPKFKSSSSPKSSSKGKGKAKFSPSPSNLSPSKPSKLRNDIKVTPASPIAQVPILEQDVFDSLPYHYDSVSLISPCDEAVTPAMKAAYDDTASVYSVASSVISVNSYLMPGLSPAPSQSSLTKTPKSSKIPIAAKQGSNAMAKPVPFVITPPTPPTPFLSLASMPSTPDTPEISFPPLTPLPVVPSTLPKLSTSTPPSPALAPLTTSLPSFSKSPLASVSSTSLPPLIPPSEFPPSPTSPPPSTELPALPTGLPGLSAVKGLKDKGKGPEI
jgi:hypothetical protein